MVCVPDDEFHSHQVWDGVNMGHANRRGNGLSLPRGFGEMYALNNERAVNEYEKNSRIKKKSDYLDGVCSG